jgi:hypothetical protein
MLMGLSAALIQRIALQEGRTGSEGEVYFVLKRIERKFEKKCSLSFHRPRTQILLPPTMPEA